MPTILPIQTAFDKAIPDNFGNAEYRTERENARANAVLALRMSILRKRLCLSLRKFSLALSHSDLYKWFCGINRFALPKVPGKSTVGELENSILRLSFRHPQGDLHD